MSEPTLTIEALRQARETVAEGLRVLQAFRGADAALTQAMLVLEGLDREGAMRRAAVAAELEGRRRDAQDGLDRLAAAVRETQAGLDRMDAEARTRREGLDAQEQGLQRQINIAQANLGTLEVEIAQAQAMARDERKTLEAFREMVTHERETHAARMAEFAHAETAAQARLDGLRQALKDAVEGALGDTPTG